MRDFQTNRLQHPEVVYIAVRENSRMATQLLCAALARERSFEVFGIGDISEISSPIPHILLVSAGNPPRLAFELVEEMRRKHPETKAVLLVEDATRELVVEAFRAGVRGVFSRNEPLETLSKCILSVNDGQVWANQAEIGFLLGAINEPMPMPLVDAKGSALLSKREQSVVRCVAEGMTNREIADQLQLSEHTVKNYLFRIFDKLGVSSRVELIIYAVSKLAPSMGSASEIREVQTPREEPVPLTACSDVAMLSKQFKPYLLAESYREGRGVPRDKVTALMWFKVAEALAGELQGQSKISQQELKAAMSPKQIEEAHQRTAELLSRRITLSPVKVERSASRRGRLPEEITEGQKFKVHCADPNG